MTEIARPLRMPAELPATALQVLGDSDELSRYERLTDRAREIRDRLAQTGRSARSQAALRDRERAAEAMYQGRSKPKTSEVEKLDAERERITEEQEALGLALGRARGDLMIAARRHAEREVEEARARAADAHERAVEAIASAREALAQHAVAWAEAGWWREVGLGVDPGRFAAATGDAMVSGRLREIEQRIDADQADRLQRWASAERGERTEPEVESAASSLRQRGAHVF